MELVFLHDVGYLNDHPMYEYNGISKELIDARIVMNEGFHELEESGILFCYKVDDRIRQLPGSVIRNLDVIDRTGISRRKKHSKKLLL